MSGFVLSENKDSWVWRISLVASIEEITMVVDWPMVKRIMGP